ncbi:MAG: hypothetical protein ABI771_08145 [Betaproteobacteria bacterium]
MKMNWVARIVMTVSGFAFASITGWAESDYRDLKGISFFGSITATVHAAGSDNATKPDLSSAQLTQRAETRFIKLFPGIPYRRTDASNWSAPENVNAMGRLSCRAWIDADLATAAYQIKCRISTTAHPNIIEDGSIGYAPKDKVGDMVNQQIDRILAGFGAIFQSVRTEP